MFVGKKKLGIIAGVALVLFVVGGGVGFAVATGSGGVTALGGDGDDQPITGSALEDCTAAALAENPGGTVTETEVGDDGAAYGVEVQRPDGSQVEVNLDGNCEVIGQEADDDGPNDQDGPNDD